MATQLDSLKATIEGLAEDAEKFFDKGNNAAAVRLRKGLQDVKKIATELRQLVTDTKKANKSK
jgi:hypothetical protein